MFLGTIVWFLSLTYRERRVSLYALGDGRRALLYVAAVRREGDSVTVPIDGVDLGSISMLSVALGA